MKLAKILLTVSFSICILIGLTPRAMSRNAIPGQRSTTSEDPSTVNPTGRDRALDGMSILYGINKNANTSIPPPLTLKLFQHGNYLATGDPQFIVTYDGFTDEARAAFQYAVDIWNSLIRSPVPIRIDASFTDLGGFDGETIILGGARPAGWKSPGSLDLWFPEALADTRADRDLAAGEPDIITRFNSHEDANWYFGTDGNTPAGKTDFVSTVLHEIAHGLGFFSFASVEEGAVYGFTSVSGTQVNVELIFDGTDFDTDATLTFTVGADAIVGYNGTALTAQLSVSTVVEVNPSVTAFAPQPLTETTLNESTVTLTLSTGVYAQSSANISRAVQVSGIPGVTFLQSDVGRVSDTRITVKLTFDGTDFDTDAVLTFTIGADAIANYDGVALIASIPVTAVVEERPTITATATQPLTEATLNGSIIRLTLNNGTYVRSNFDIDSAVTVSGIAGVTVGFFGVERVSDTVIVFELEFNGNVDTNATLTFTVEADAIAEYDGPALIAHIIVNGGQESVVASTEAPLTETTLNGSVVTLTLNGATYKHSPFDLRDTVSVSGIEGATFHWFDLDRVSDTALTVELTFRGNIDADAVLTFTVGADAIADYDGPALTTQLIVTGSKESVTAATEAPLVEATLDGSIVTLTLNGRTYERSRFRIREAVSVSGIDAVTVGDVDRIGDTEITVELEFNGDIDTDATLTLTVAADALLRYNGPAFTVQLPVMGGQESVAASTEAPLTEAALDGSTVTLTLSGRKYARSILDIRRAVSVYGIDGVTIPWHEPDKKSDTEITIELEFDGNMNADSTLTFTVGAGAIAGYNGPALTAQVVVTADRENALLANFPNPFNPETWIPYQLAKPSDVTLTIYAVNGQVVRTLTLGHQLAGIYQSRSRAAYWDGRNAVGEPVASGVYFYTITAGDFTATRKMLIRK